MSSALPQQASRSVDTGNSNGPMDSKVMKILECPICLDSPMTAPIYLCMTGHSICSECWKRVSRCGLCAKKYTKARNFVAENMIDTSLFRCKYEDQGCVAVKTGEYLNAHQLHCIFRPILCNHKLEKPCTDNPVNVTDFISHLRNRHQCIGFDHHQLVYSIPQRSRLSRGRSEEYYYVKYDGKFFIQHTRVDRDSIYWWTSIMGSQEEAKNYQCKIVVRPAKHQTEHQNMKMEFTAPIFTTHDRFEDIAAVSGFGGSLKKAAIRQLFEPIPNQADAISRWSWILELSIFKAGDKLRRSSF